MKEALADARASRHFSEPYSLGNRRGSRHRLGPAEVHADPGVGVDDDGARLIHRAAVVRPTGADFVLVIMSRGQGRRLERALLAALCCRIAVEPDRGVGGDENLHVGAAVGRVGRRRSSAVSIKLALGEATTTGGWP